MSGLEDDQSCEDLQHSDPESDSIDSSDTIVNSDTIDNSDSKDTCGSWDTIDSSDSSDTSEYNQSCVDLQHGDPESELGAQLEVLGQVLERLPLLVVLLGLCVAHRVHFFFCLQFCNIVS